MVELRKGNLFDAGTQAIVNTVNCFGVMGKGIALEYKMRYPQMFHEYVGVCRRNELRPGGIWRYAFNVSQWPNVVYNFATKDHWRDPSKLEWIAAGLDELRSYAIMDGVASIALPALGCANGGLRFEDVRPLVEEKLNDLQIPVILFEPQ